MLSQLRPAIVMIALFTALTGLAYPLLMTSVTQIAFPVQANGSLIERQGKVVGAEMIGQSFRSERYFHGRPSAADYNAAASSGSNLGATNKGLVDAVRERAAAVSRDGAGTVPVDLVTASGSGLDPHLTPEAALVQVERIAAVRGIPARELRAMVAKAIEPRSLGLFGETRVNVLRLNMMLDEMQG
jgi:potassium-transporting ATPase KdpC subunit